MDLTRHKNTEYIAAIHQ